MTNISVLPVQNGTTVLSLSVISYVERYKSFARQTAESIIGLAQTLIEAEEQLSPIDFRLFCEEVSVPKGSPVYKKLRIIGKEATRFQPFVNQLPNTWTTIYKLAKLEPDQFDKVSSILSPFVTAKEIDQELGTKEVKLEAKVSNAPDIKISLDWLGLEEKSEVYNCLSELKKKFGFSLESTEELQQQIFSFHKQSHAA